MDCLTDRTDTPKRGRAASRLDNGRSQLQDETMVSLSFKSDLVYIKRFLGPLAALSFLVGAELDALLHGDWVPSPYVLIGAIVVGVVVGYVIAVGRD
jgi:hypothetical protein